MTDGLLLAETQNDQLLRRYDTIIVDEAHERSLNIDFLLGYLARILPRRPDLKVIITSATIDPERFAATSAAPRWSRCRAAPTPSRSATGRSRTPTIPTATRPTRSATRSRSCCASARGDVLVFLSRRARDPRHRRGARRAAALRHRHPAALRAALHARAAARLQAARRPPRRARHERGRDVADRAGDPLRRRSRDGADQPLQRAPEGAAAADRADLAGLRRPAQGPLRPRGRGHRHPALLRGGLRGAPALHRPGDPAHEPRVGDPPDGGGGARRHRGLPVPRPARPAPGARRHPAAAGAGGARRRASA